MNNLQPSDMQVFEIPVADIFCDNSFNCRGAILKVDVLDLARSIDEQGLQQPITVQPWAGDQYKWRIVSGHRRWNAFKVLNRKTIPAIIKGNLDELTARQLNLEENLKRKDLNILQESNAIQPFVRAGWTQDEIAKRFNQSRGWVQARCALIELPEEIQQEAAAGFLSQEQIKQLKTIRNKQAQFEAVKKIKQSKIAGEKKKIKILPPKKINPLQKKKRESEDIFKMMELFMDVVGPGFYSRCLAWAAGEINDFDLMRDFKIYAEAQGKSWQIPIDVVKAVTAF